MEDHQDQYAAYRPPRGLPVVIVGTLAGIPAALLVGADLSAAWAGRAMVEPGAG